jgi:GH15 family glucan-1,4-alpha-glucosidase
VNNQEAGSEPHADKLTALQDLVRIIPYPAIERHGIVGDRRTAALVAADGTVDWLCLPDFDGVVVFGALLDWFKGGHWRLGPARMTLGQQKYQEDSLVLETCWDLEEGTLLLEDAMLWPEQGRPPEQTDVRAMVRGLRCVRGTVRCELELQAGYNFQQNAAVLAEYTSGFTLQLSELSLRFWAKDRPDMVGSRLHRVFQLKEGEEFWAVLELGAAGHGWSVESARGALEQVRQYWRSWVGELRPEGNGDKEVRRSAMTVHLLTYAPAGSVVAAPTTSVPERIGGDWNADYRLCWVRDASLSVSMLAWLGNLRETEQYLQWLVQRLSYFGRPLQVLYGIRGEKRPSQKQRLDIAGYRDSKPVRIGNHAYKQHQLGSYGYLADCVWNYLQEGGQWRDEYWKLIHRLASFTAKHWQKPENGIWELPERQHYLNSKVLSWVTLDRAIRIAQKVNPSFDTSNWQASLEAIHAEVMEKGWSEQLGAFRQRYEAENLDAAALLIPVMGFLPADHPRVLATMDRIAEFLSIDDFVLRFDPIQTPSLGHFPLGQLEGAFFLSTFWLATAYAKAGQPDRAERILKRAERLAGSLGLFSEAADPRTGNFLGNTPLLFSHVEYVRAKLEIAHVRAG